MKFRPREAQGTALDLSRFAVPEGAESDDDCLVPTMAEIAVPLMQEESPSSPSPTWKERWETQKDKRERLFFTFYSYLCNIYIYYLYYIY